MSSRGLRVLLLHPGALCEGYWPNVDEIDSLTLVISRKMPVTQQLHFMTHLKDLQAAVPALPAVAARAVKACGAQL